MKSSEISNENVSCGHTQDGQHGYACQHRAAAVREIWGKLDLIFTFSGMQVTTIGITFCPPFFSCLALIKNFGPSRSSICSVSQILVNKSDKSDHPHQREPWCFAEVVNKVGAAAMPTLQ